MDLTKRLSVDQWEKLTEYLALKKFIEFPEDKTIIIYEGYRGLDNYSDYELIELFSEYYFGDNLPPDDKIDEEILKAIDQLQISKL